MFVHKNLAELLKVCSVLPVLAVMPAMADMPNVSGNAWVFGDLNLDYDVAHMSAIGGRLIIKSSAKDGRVNDFPKYNVVGRSVKLSGTADASTDIYVGPVNMTLRELADDDAFAYNYQDYGKNDNPNWEGDTLDSDELSSIDIDIAKQNGIVWDDSAQQIMQKNNWTNDAWLPAAVAMEKFASRDNNANAGSLDIDFVNMTVDGATIEADEISMKNSSMLVVKQNVPDDIRGGVGEHNASDGKTTIVANDFNVKNNSRLVIKAGAELDLSGAGDVEFENNVLDAENGGAIYNEGKLTLKDADFEKNSASSAGAIYNTGALNIIGATFENNSAKSSAGAIQNSGENSLIYVEDTEFIGNKSGGSFGAMVSGTATQSTIIKDSEFKNNSALDVGALGLYSDATLSDVDFIENKALSAQNGYDGAGAVFLGAESKIVMDDVDFIRNTSALRGGAISTRSADLANNSAARLDILNSTFVGNTAETTGGAFDNYLYSSKTDATAVYMQTVQFTGNSATQGGAIYNHGDADKAGNVASMRLNNVTFVGNQATDTGGAIYNEAGAGITFQGINTFAKNTAAKKPNDIYNDGLINIESGTTSMAAGVVGNGTFTISKDATLNLGTGMIRQDIINIDGTINASVLNPERSYAKIFADKELNIGDTAKLNLTVGSVGTYDVFNGRLSGIDIDIDVGDTYKVSETQDGIVVAIKPVEELAQDTGLNTDTAAVVIGLATTSSPTAQRVSLAAQNALKRGDIVQVEQELAKLNPDDKPVAQSVSTSVQSQVMTLATNRMSGATGAIGRAGGDNANDVSGVWAQGLFNKSKLADQFHGYTRGFAIGADTTIGKDWLLGAGFAYNDSDVHASGRRTDIDGKTLFVYGQYKPTNWFVNGTLAYTMSEYTESVNPFGEYITSDYDVDTYGAQLMTGYDMAYGFTPSIGVRYMHVAQDAYTNTVNSFDSVDTDYLTGVAGLKYAFTIQTNNALKFSPEFRAALTYDFINDDVNTNVVIPGGMGSYQIAAERLSEFGGEFGIGLNMQYRGIDLSLVYDLAIHQDYTSQTGMIKLRSQF